MSFTDILQIFSSNIYLYVGAFVLVLSVLVFVHEWGHYIVARMCGIRVEIFSIGFGKELFGFYDKRGTRWKVSLVPLGGYVKLFGDVDPASVKHAEAVEDSQSQEIRPLTEAEKTVAFYSKPVWKRALVVVAGPAINYLFAIVILSAVFMTNGQPVTPAAGAAVIAGSSADKAGFQPHDKIVSIDGRTVNDFDDIRREMMISLDTPRRFVIERNGRQVTLRAKPQKIEMEDRFGFKHSIGLLGLISPRHAIDITTITKIDGVAYSDEAEIRRQIDRRIGTRFTLETGQKEKPDVLIVEPLQEFNEGLRDPEHENYNVLYIAEGENNVFLTYPPLVAVQEALRHTWNVTVGTGKALGQIIMGTRSATELGGVIRIGTLAGDMAQQGLVTFLLFTALLSINLGLVNLFPVPMLDGGHLVFYAFEAILGRPVSDHVQEYAFRFGLVFLVGLMVFANLNDIMQLIL